MAGVLSTTTPACALGAGDDGANPTGAGCNVADLCAAEWHVCTTPAEVGASSSTGCVGATAGGDPDLFFATRQSGPGSGDCGAGANDLFGCGNWGSPIIGSGCAPFDVFSHNLCNQLGPPWDCGSDDVQEANNVVKTAADGGGVLCCRD